MKIAVSQLNYTIGDIPNNCKAIIAEIKRLEASADLIVFSELSIPGYPPMDLIENNKFISDNIEAALEVAKASSRCGVIFGYINREDDGKIYNVAALAEHENITAIRNKALLPTYDVFDEKRYFAKATEILPVEFMGKKLGLTVCEDIWNSAVDEKAEFTDFRSYSTDPVAELCKKGIDILINISASPFVMKKNIYKQKFISSIAKKYNIALIYCNQVGGNDSLIFDGTSFAINADGQLACIASSFAESSFIFDTQSQETASFPKESLADVERALCLGIKDYMRKCGFKKALVGLSGGIDSALTATLAVKALGSENVMGITMPSVYSSKGSVSDSQELANNLGIAIEEIPIQPIFQMYGDSLSHLFSGLNPDVTEENLQARIRGTLLMAASNKFGALLLTTGNKSELAMGYCTLYGDMNGGLAVISDVPKTLVYELSKFINQEKILIPENTITKPPSAELREDQKDEDSLPPYEILDAILKEYVENRKSQQEIRALGFDDEIVSFVLRMVDRNEYKRRQAAPGLKITSKAFGSGRRIPMAQRFRP